ncbi:rIIB protector from prophage-induced early lysis [Aeromonas phage AS-szw]|uniref:RIIB protector from prophage-induced early lysis n=1 Tax=Aeromonas phage AS-szw TaxID=2026114 RepID=A0A291LER4_9CAUD|nr:rIIB protector from prophage-induced early lysis [Aeromonas phage AS-szw]
MVTIHIEKLEALICSGIYDISGNKVKELDNNRTFAYYNLDDLDVVELVMYIEDELDIDLGDIGVLEGWESLTIKELIKLIIGTNKIDFQFDVNDSSENKVEESRDDKIIRLHNRGFSQNEISRQTGIPRSTVGDVVRRYKGIQKKSDKTIHLKDIIEPVHTPVVSWNASYDFINCFIDGTPYVADRAHPRFEDAFQLLIRDNDVVGAVNLISIKEAIKTYSSGDIRIEGDTLYYRDIVLDTSMTRRIIDMWASGEEFEYMVTFLKNLLQNPRRAAVYELFDFLTHSDIKITNDGHFLAYKRVTEDYKDIRTHTFDNSIGSKPRVEPFEVDDDRNNTCAAGLHAAARHYIPYYSSCENDRVVMVKINPAHVVAIPTDYDNAKLRTWTYEVISDVTHEF